ncbi:hypothetical protein EIP91_001959 [Steccherinum ochraceum]|uniref:F-box domain-containing protein n=1 Tax=Steccherinum ochraceum TaxID=92696 RepID=A0A4V2MWE5_9APHY|nr:hypothetical protein EIP91_001959 [Steccherinum ochraceum]
MGISSGPGLMVSSLHPSETDSHSAQDVEGQVEKYRFNNSWAMLPPELVHACLSALPPSDLHPCSVVCRSWRPHAQRLSFKSVALSPSPVIGEDRFLSFRYFVEDANHIARSILQLSLTNSWSMDRTKLAVKTPLGIAWLVSALPHLQHLVLQYMTLTTCQYQSGTLDTSPKEIRSLRVLDPFQATAGAIEDLLRRFSIQEVLDFRLGTCLQYDNEPGIQVHCRSIRYDGPLSCFPDLSHASFPRLRELVVFLKQIAGDHHFDAIRIAGIYSYRISSNTHHGNMSKFLYVHGHQLQQITIDFTTILRPEQLDIQHDGWAIFDLSQACPSLQTLHLHFRINFKLAGAGGVDLGSIQTCDIESSHTVECIARILQSAPSTLRQVQLKISAYYDKGRQGGMPQIDASQGIAPLVHALNPDALPALEYVHVLFRETLQHLIPAESATYRWGRTFMLKHFATLEERGLFKYTEDTLVS